MTDKKYKLLVFLIVIVLVSQTVNAIAGEYITTDSSLGAVTLSAGNEWANMQIGDTVSGSFTDIGGDSGGTTGGENYRFTLDKSGKVIFYVDEYSEGRCIFRLLTEGGSEFAYIVAGGVGGSTYVYLNAGNYYFTIDEGTFHLGSKDVTYKVTTSFEPCDETMPESLSDSYNTAETAKKITLNNKYIGLIAAYDDKSDYYTFDLDKPGIVSAHLQSPIKYGNSIELYSLGESDKISSAIYSSVKNKIGADGFFTYDEIWYLQAGTYYFNFYVDAWSSSDVDMHTGVYDFNLAYTPVDETLKESIVNNNDTLFNAYPIEGSKEYKGFLGINDGNDYLKFDLTEKGDVSINATSASDLYVKLLNAAGREIRSEFAYAEPNSHIDITESLEKGTYYICFRTFGGQDSYGEYSFKLTGDGIPDIKDDIDNPKEETDTPTDNSLTLHKEGAVSEEEIVRRIDEIRSVFPGDKDGYCFSAGGRCTHGAGDTCDNCKVQNVIPALGLGKALKKKAAWTCLGFASFVYEYVFRQPFQDDASNMVAIGEKAHGWDYGYVKEHARIGDVLRMKLSNGYQHFSIYMGADEENKKIIVYESNGVAGWATNAVHYGPDQHKIKTVTILRNKAYNKAIKAAADKTMMVTVACPVDVEVYKDGNLVGRVKNNAVDEDVTDIDLHVFGEEKNFLIPCDENYQVRLSATGEGEMSYTVEETDTDNYEIKQFSNVALTSGQKMLSDINPDISGNRLYITDDEGNILMEILADGSEIDIAGIGGKRSTETITIGSDVYTVSWNSFVRFDGRKHNGVGLDTDGRGYNETVTTGKVSDVKVVITKNGNIINPSNYKFKNRNNKNASVSIDGITAIQTNERKMPSFSIIFKDEENKDVNLLFKKKKFRYGIFPLELNGDYMSFDRKTATKNGVTKFKKVTFNPKVMSDQIQPKTLKLKYKSNAGKTDYYTTASENGDIIVHGQNNYYGSVVYKK